MRDTQTRVGLVNKRVRQRQRTREKCILSSLSALCLVLSIFLAGAMGALMESGHSTALSLSGSMLLHEDVGGYVLVGVVSFAAAVVITTLCIRYRKRSEEEPGEDGRS